MTRYAISSEGAIAMKSLARQLYTEANAILEASSVLEASVEATGDGLGIYSDEIISIIQRSRSTLRKNREEILGLAEKVAQKAAEIEELVSLGFDDSSGQQSNLLSSSNNAKGTNSSAQAGQSHSKQFSSIVNTLKQSGVAYNAIAAAPDGRTSADIINSLSGGDMTQGSCSSLAFAYAGNKAGYNVLDFRDGYSRIFFSSRNSIQSIADMPDVQSVVYNGTNDFECAKLLLSTVQTGKEYYLASGCHAAIIRKNSSGGLEYLELQHPSTGNGWHPLNEYILQNRFGCRSTRSIATSNFLMDVDSMSNSQEFLDILGYINTAAIDQRKGGAGNVR